MCLWEILHTSAIVECCYYFLLLDLFDAESSWRQRLWTVRHRISSSMVFDYFFILLKFINIAAALSFWLLDEWLMWLNSNAFTRHFLPWRRCQCFITKLIRLKGGRGRLFIFFFRVWTFIKFLNPDLLNHLQTSFLRHLRDLLHRVSAAVMIFKQSTSLLLSFLQHFLLILSFDFLVDVFDVAERAL